MTTATARVRWGNQRFWRINEFDSVDAARAFAEELRATHERSVNVSIEVRDRAAWVVIEQT